MSWTSWKMNYGDVVVTWDQWDQGYPEFLGILKGGIWTMWSVSHKICAWLCCVLSCCGYIISCYSIHIMHSCILFISALALGQNFGGSFSGTGQWYHCPMPANQPPKLLVKEVKTLTYFLLFLGRMQYHVILGGCIIMKLCCTTIISHYNDCTAIEFHKILTLIWITKIYFFLYISCICIS